MQSKAREEGMLLNLQELLSLTRVETRIDKITILRYLEDDEEDMMNRCKLSYMDKLENTEKRE